MHNGSCTSLGPMSLDGEMRLILFLLANLAVSGCDGQLPFVSVGELNRSYDDQIVLLLGCVYFHGNKFDRAH